MAIIHIDYATGDDTTGDGSSGTPYKTLTKAFAVLTTADSIKIANTSAQQETNLAFPALTFTLDAPLIIEGWDNGGSIEINSPAGNYTGVGQIDNGGTTNPLFSNAIAQVRFYRIKFTDFNTAFWSTAKTGVSFVQCEFNDCAGAGETSACFMTGCYYLGPTAYAVVNFGNQSWIYGNYFSRVRHQAMGAGTQYQNNIAIDHDVSAVSINGDHLRIVNNTFIGQNLGSATANSPIRFSADTAENIVIIGNHFQDYSGAGGYGVETIVTLPATRGTVAMIGGNSFYNVNTTYETGILATAVVDITATDITEVADPLENIAGLEYQKKTTSLSYEENPSFTGWVETNTLSNMTTGAVPNEAGSGGGGGIIGGSWGYT